MGDLAAAVDIHDKDSRPAGPNWSRVVALASLYIAVWVGLWHLSESLKLSQGISLWYPATGLTFAILLKFGLRALPLPIMASLIVGLSSGSWPQWPQYLMASLLPPLGYALGAHLLRERFSRQPQGKWRFNEPQQAALFLAAAAAGSLVAALSGVALERSMGLPASGSSLWKTVLSWWGGDFVGVVTVTPLVLVSVAPLARQFLHGKPLRWSVMRWPSHPSVARLAVAQAILSIVVLVIVLWMSARFWPHQPQPFLSLLLLPVLTWIAATHNLRGAVLAIFLYELAIVTLVALFGTADQALQYQIVTSALAASGLLTGAASQARLAHMARLRDLAEVSNDLLWEFDARGRLCDLAGRFGKSVAWDGQGEFWRAYVVPQVQDTDFTALEDAIRQRRSFQLLVLRLRLPNQEQSVWTLSSGLPLIDEDGEFLGYRGATTDITEHKKAEALLRDYDQKLQAEVVERTRTLAEASQRNWRLANFDSLTSLPNRNLFFEHLRIGLQQAQRQARLAALLMVDLDGFKEVNDTYGHDRGDELLREIANRLQQCVRTTDTVARLGGDEFTIILLNLEQAQGAESVAAKIVERLAKPIALEEGSVTVTASVGIALYQPEWPYTLELAMRLLRRADAAMYAAKNAGKNAWRFAEPMRLNREADG